MATIKQVANKIGKDLNESYPNVQSLFDVLKRGFKDMENVSGGGSGGSEVDWTQLQASGTKIAEIEIDGDTTNVYAPASQTIGVSQIQTTGTKIASISLDGVSTDLYAPNGGGGASAPTKRIESAANQTYAAQLTELKTVFDTLSDEEKRGSFIIIGNSKYNLFDIRGGYGFFRVNGTDLQVNTIYVADSTAFSGNVAVSGTYQTITNVTNSLSMALYA